MNKQSYPTLEEMLFENRNKAYGAYDLRNNGKSTLLKALLIGSSILVVFASAIYFLQNKTSSTSAINENAVTVTIVNLAEHKPKIVEPKIEEAAPSMKQKDTKQAKHILPEPKKTVEKEATVRNVQELDKHDLSFENREGKIDSDGQVGGGKVNENGNETYTGAQVAVVNNTISESKKPTTPEKINARQAKVMAIYPGCEKVKSQGNDALTKCMSQRLSQDLSNELIDFSAEAERNNLTSAVAKMQFIVNTNGEITQIVPISGSDDRLAKASEKALTTINRRLQQKGKKIIAAETTNGEKADLIFSIPVKFNLQ